jgi:hypothetical protein
MPETHAIAGPARGETLPPGHVGACVKFPLDAPPTARWSDALTARLATSITGHAGIGHLKLDHLVQGADIVLEGVEPDAAEDLGPALKDAIAAANRVCEDDGPSACNMEPREAEKMAQAVEAGARTR